MDRSCGNRRYLCFKHAANANLRNLSATVPLLGNRSDVDLRRLCHWHSRDYVFSRASFRSSWAASGRFDFVSIAAAGAIIFLFANAAAAWLFPARILSGLAIALASGASASWIVEFEPQ